MSWRTVIISNQAKLDYKMGYLVVRAQETHRVLIDEIAVLVLENTAVSLTGCLMEALIEKKVRIIFCDSKHNPCAEVTAYHGSHDSSAKIRNQASWSKEAKDKVWQEIICQKIYNQEMLLRLNGKRNEANLLKIYINQVEPGDLTNREGHAAKVYFNALFGKDFSRSDDNPINAALNYGYGILLATINREIAANGYLTQMGIFHDNMFNHFNLGCDLMEPFRPLIDKYVFEEMPKGFDKQQKHDMWKIAEKQVYIDGTHQSLANAIKTYTKNTLDAVTREDLSLIKRVDYEWF